MPTLRRHTYLQAAQANTQTKTCKRVCLPDRTPNGELADRKEQQRHNRRSAKKRAKWLIEHSTLHLLLL